LIQKDGGAQLQELLPSNHNTARIVESVACSFCYFPRAVDMSLKYMFVKNLVWGRILHR
jgi:hypothetical protein